MVVNDSSVTTAALREHKRGIMTGKQRFLQTMQFQQPDRPPHFESMFELEQEAFGRSFPDRHSWAGMTPAEKDAAIGLCMSIYEQIVERFKWDALAVYWPWSDPDGIRAAKSTFGEDLAIGGIIGRTVWSIESIGDWIQFSTDLMENPQVIHEEAERRLQATLPVAERMVEAGADFILLVNDVAFNAGPFISPRQFAEIVTPYYQRAVEHIKSLGVICIVHSDGNLMPVLDQMLSLKAHCLHSIDPMAGMDIAEVKRLTYPQMALMGNVQCNLLQDGPLEAIRESVLYALNSAAPGGGYVFSTSNTIFPGMPLEHYEYMLEVFREWCQKS
jgi:uroporphyrinogen decarboxylase